MPALDRAPAVYIDGRLMDSYAHEDVPVLAGLTFRRGSDSYIDLETAGTASMQLLVSAGADITWLDLGMVLVIHQPTAEDGTYPNAFTYFAGRIQRLEAVPHPSKAGALLVSINTTDLLPDLENTKLASVSYARSTALARRSGIDLNLPAGWSLETEDPRYPNKPSAELVEKDLPLLDLVDPWLRSQIMLRRTNVDYDPATNTLEKSLVLLADATKAPPADHLGIYPQYTARAGQWGVVVLNPATYTFTTRLSAKNVAADVGWIKDTNDMITSVDLGVIEEPGGTGSKRHDVNSAAYLDTAALRERYGLRTLAMDTDMPANVVASDVAPVMQHWITTDTMWRTRDLRIVDADKLTRLTLALLLSNTYLYSAYIVVPGLTPARPDPELSDLRGVVTAVEATWTGKKWDISVTLGRVPPLPVDGDWWTPARVAAYTNPNTFFQTAIRDATCATVGNDLTFADFKRIGAP